MVINDIHIALLYAIISARCCTMLVFAMFWRDTAAFCSCWYCCARFLHTAETVGYMHGVPSSHHGAPPSASSSSSSSSPSYAYSYDVAPRPPCPPPARTSRLSFAGMMTWMSCHQEESRGGTAGGLSSGRHRHDDVIIEACHHPAWYHGGISGRLNDGH